MFAMLASGGGTISVIWSRHIPKNVDTKDLTKGGVLMSRTKGPKKMKKKPYSKRTDLEKLNSNWNKTCGLFRREEYSLAIVRAATTVEIACNFVIRQELISMRSLPDDFVDSLLIWANGLTGKFTRLLKKITTDERRKQIISVHKSLKKLYKHRNGVAHSGEFKKKSTAQECLASAIDACHTLVQYHEPKFTLKDWEEPTFNPTGPT